MIIDTPIGRLVAALPPELSAALGESIALEWFPETLHAPGGNPRRQPAQPGHARGWESARDVAGALLESGDAGLRAAGERLVPRPGARLAEQLMLFIGKGDGDIARWIGETTRRQLEAARQGELLARSENATAREPDRGEASEWRHVTVPLFDGQQLRPIDIHARRRRMNDRGRPRDQSRFIVECQHDDFGAIQIDGLLTAGDGRRRLDIILRTHAEIPAEDRAAIDALFADACGAIGMQGELVFQAVARFPDMLHDAAALHRSVVA
ncbi:MAG: hypothetical protein JNK67_02610 [Alphaproteobacteria bacterium]|nr:hypothetical protein [Alphaproteobacteria bacterium]